MSTQTNVVFRKFKDTGDIIALFVDETNYPDGSIESYMHVGQHSAASYHHVVTITKPAKPDEYEALARELKQRGYSLRVLTRNMRWKAKR